MKNLQTGGEEMLPLSQYPRPSNTSISHENNSANNQSLDFDRQAKHPWTAQVDWLRNRDSRSSGGYVSPYLSRPVERTHSESLYRHSVPSTDTDIGPHFDHKDGATDATSWGSLKPAPPGILVLSGEGNE